MKHRAPYSDDVMREKLGERVSREPMSGCWLWTGQARQSGKAYYGAMYCGNRLLQAHRVSYALARGPIPEGLTIDHLCKVTLCVNPDHLRAVTLGVNVLAGDGPSAQNARKAACLRGHDNWSPGFNGRRFCATCRRERTERNREHLQAYGQAYREAHRDRLRAYMRDYDSKRRGPAEAR